MRIFERVLISVSILLIVCVFATQLFYKAGFIAPVTLQEQNVGYLDSTLYRSTETISLKISEWPKAQLLINGEKAKPAQKDGGYLLFEVYNKDVVEIDLRNTGVVEVSIFVAQVSDGITWPKAGTKIFETGGIRQLFKIEASANREGNAQ